MSEVEAFLRNLLEMQTRTNSLLEKILETLEHQTKLLKLKEKSKSVLASLETDEPLPPIVDARKLLTLNSHLQKTARTVVALNRPVTADLLSEESNISHSQASVNLKNLWERGFLGMRKGNPAIGENPRKKYYYIEKQTGSQPRR